MMKNLFLIVLLIVALQLHAQEPWFKTQVGTGRGNCGPSCVAMSLEWSTGANITVESVRDLIGYPIEDGSTTWEHLTNVLKMYDVSYQLKSMPSLNKLKEYVFRRDVVVILLVQTGGISNTEYDGDYGHYILLEDVQFNNFLVQDPYGNPDTFYDCNETWNAIKYEDNGVLVIWK